ncbi:hypothetical protein C8R43DRAFT_406524 [Mycena crocata]|nr:hypothetical protein C8R43DRAFT_406524 [Mycena crocata]
MALNRECDRLMASSNMICALVQDRPLQKIWFPQSPASEGAARIWNNSSLSGQGSNSATCRTRRISLRRQGLVVRRAVMRAFHKPFCLSFLFYLLVSFFLHFHLSFTFFPSARHCNPPSYDSDTIHARLVINNRERRGNKKAKAKTEGEAQKHNSGQKIVTI